MLSHRLRLKAEDLDGELRASVFKHVVGQPARGRLYRWSHAAGGIKPAGAVGWLQDSQDRGLGFPDFRWLVWIRPLMVIWK